MKTDEIIQFYWWLNRWAKLHENEACLNGRYITEFGRGYKQAVSDIFDKFTKLNKKEIDAFVKKEG